MVQNDSFSTFLFDIFGRFFPIREIFNVANMAFKSTSYHLNMLTAKQWYTFILFFMLFFIFIFFFLIYFQNQNYNILKHIKLKHNWILYETPEYPKYCTNCSGIIKKRFLLMRNYEGWQCLFCKRISHLHCIIQSDSQSCKVESTLNIIVSNSLYNGKNDMKFYHNSNSGNEEMKDFVHMHVLVKGNLQSGSVCSICRTACFTPFCLSGQTCIWCNRTFHDECADSRHISNQECDLGTLKYIILPPNSFNFELVKANKIDNRIINKEISVVNDDLKEDTCYKNLRLRKIGNISATTSFRTSTQNYPQKRRISEFIQRLPNSCSYEKKLRFCDNFLSNKSKKPLLVFVNTRSGGHFGQKLIKDLYIYLNPIQIIDIQRSNGPDEALIQFKELAESGKLLILVCGGDGTVRWVIDRCRDIYKLDSEKLPPVAVLPLGTGNDLSRILGWDVSFDGNILNFLKRICTSNIKKMDIWTCSALDIDKKKSGKTDNQNVLFSSTFLNYLDIGIAARIALKFHNLREEYPQHFNSRFGNQLVYGEVGLKDFFLNRSIQLDGLRIWCDGKEINILNIGRSNIDDDNYNAILNKSDTQRILNISSLLSNDNFFSRVFTYFKYLLSKIVVFTEFCGLNIKIKHDFMEKTDDRVVSINKKDQRLEGLVICNIPSFAGGVNLWKVPENYPQNITKNLFSPNISEKSTSTVNKSVNERSMSFSICNVKDSGSLCSHDLSDDEDLIELNHGFNNERIRSTNKLKNWFSNAFKKSFPVVSRQEKLNMSSETENHTSFRLQKIDDGLIEVVGIKSLFHLTQLQVGLTEPIKLCQGSDIVVEIPRQVPFQVDGEPRIINKCQLIIKSSGKIPVVCSEKVENTVPLFVKNALELAVQRNILDNTQRNWITKQIKRESRI